MASMTRLPLRRLSICKCGFGVLLDEIPIGTIYSLDLSTEGSASYRCGGCGQWQVVQAVRGSRGNLPKGLIPLGLFVDGSANERVQ